MSVTEYPFEYVLVFGEEVSRELQQAVARELSSNGLSVKQVDCHEVCAWLGMQPRVFIVHISYVVAL